ncbi:MAG: hypothetical protein AMJ62_16400 [Myxococcales bacterium SG8_38]|nr:MAG: hypothetical protein AMJ62_16400 [Myxococcales bacterium SG8_38]
MKTRLLCAFFVAPALLAASCADDSSSVSVNVKSAGDFTQFQTFSVVTKEMAEENPDFPDLDADQEAFNNSVNNLIIEAMQAEPVCLTFIRPQDVTEQNQPDLWAANGLGRETEGGYYYDCCGGYWWGYWGWYWDPCAYWCPQYVEYDVGSLLIPVASLPAASGEEPDALFLGLAQTIIQTAPDVDTKVREAVDRIFQQWPEKRTCPEVQ